jgi:hypothetical protein
MFFGAPDPWTPLTRGRPIRSRSHRHELGKTFWNLRPAVAPLPAVAQEMTCGRPICSRPLYPWSPHYPRSPRKRPVVAICNRPPIPAVTLHPRSPSRNCNFSWMAVSEQWDPNPRSPKTRTRPLPTRALGDFGYLRGYWIPKSSLPSSHRAFHPPWSVWLPVRGLEVWASTRVVASTFTSSFLRLYYQQKSSSLYARVTRQDDEEERRSP